MQGEVPVGLPELLQFSGRCAFFVRVAEYAGDFGQEGVGVGARNAYRPEERFHGGGRIPLKEGEATAQLILLVLEPTLVREDQRELVLETLQVGLGPGEFLRGYQLDGLLTAPGSSCSAARRCFEGGESLSEERPVLELFSGSVGPGDLFFVCAR